MSSKKSLWIIFVSFLLSHHQKCSLAKSTNSLNKLEPTEASLSVMEPIQQPYEVNSNPKTLDPQGLSHLHRIPRAVHQISLSDPLDCLSQIVCGLNSYPPQPPSVRTKTANDFAYLLKNVIVRLKKQELPDLTMMVKAKPEVNKTTGNKSKEELNDDESDEDDDNDFDLDNDEAGKDADEDELDKDKKPSAEKDDIVRLQDLYPPLGLITRRIGRSKKNNKGKSNKKSKKKSPPSPLERLRMETDIRQKLRSDARCVQGILDHTCPFNYQELMVLTSGVLERQRTVSYSTNKILPLVGYLLKSRSLTETLKATFTALERINNITLTKDAKKEEISFRHIYDEIINGDLGDIGIRIVETKNDVAGSNVWEDDEFDEALNNPVVQRKNIKGYEIKNKKKDTQEDDISDSEESHRPHVEADNIFDEIFPNESPEDDDNESDNGQETEESDLPLPQLYGFNRS